MIKEFVALGPTMNIYLANDLCVVQKKATSKKNVLSIKKSNSKDTKSVSKIKGDTKS